MTDSSAPAATAARAIAGALARHIITAAGSAIVARGYLDQATVDGATGPLADYAVGAALLAASGAWAWARAHLTHTRWAAAWQALNARPDPQP